jgi:hypothetical protein
METEIAGDAQETAAFPQPVRDDSVVRVQEDYFAFDIYGRTMFPDGVSYVEHQVMNEGARRKYLNAVNRDVRLEKKTQDAILNMRPGEERTELLKACIVGWNLTRNGQPVPFNMQNLNDFLMRANPSIINLIEKDIRLANPWLLNEMTLEDIDKEIADLQDLRAKKVEEESGKELSRVK